MRIAITAQGQDLSSQLDPRFGRAKWLILADTDTNEFEANDNTVNLNAASGAGIQTAQNVASLKAEAVITGNMGPNAFRTLGAAGVKAFLSKASTVQEALDLFKEGKLQEAAVPNVEGHWV
ncbi:MAG: NifB/NifX family molybdenum-iron cluster-binding protein [Phycisphaerae bacterium]|nr:NifB/NifX family molybdenum-iron cluster-binding protein [Phycisphaerae bacterium]